MTKKLGYRYQSLVGPGDLNRSFLLILDPPPPIFDSPRKIWIIPLELTPRKKVWSETRNRLQNDRKRREHERKVLDDSRAKYVLQGTVTCNICAVGLSILISIMQAICKPTTGMKSQRSRRLCPYNIIILMRLGYHGQPPQIGYKQQYRQAVCSQSDEQAENCNQWSESGRQFFKVHCIRFTLEKLSILIGVVLNTLGIIT